MTDRTKNLKQRTILKGFRGREYSDKRVYVDVERARFWTESYRQTEGEPETIRRAKALANLLDNMTIYIQDDEMIVGNETKDCFSIPPTVELSDEANRETIEDGYVAEEEREEFEEYMGYWKNRNMWAKVRELGNLNEQHIWTARTNYTAAAGTARDGISSSQPDYEFVFREGWGNILNLIDRKISEVTEHLHEGERVSELLSKITNWKAMKIAVEAFIRWHGRYAKLARMLSAGETEPRKSELLQIAQNLEHLATNPVESFYQAVQEMWLIQLVTHQLERFALGTSVRIDQILFPYYERDKAAGKIKPEQAQEFIECLWVKLVGTGRTSTGIIREILQGSALLQIYTLGGVKADGSDACNEITKLCMRASREIRSVQPSYCVRYHPKIPDEYVLEGLENMKMGMAFPSWENDTVVIQMLMHGFGATLEQARSWALILCKSPGPTGPFGTPRRRPWNSSAIGVLSLALNDGVYFGPVKGMEGVRIGSNTGDPTEWKSIDDLLEAYRKQYCHCFKLGWNMRNVCCGVEARYFQQPFLSACFELFIERGVDCMDGDNLPVPWYNISGLVDAGDSITAIRKLVFEDKKYAMAQLVDALKKNWEGYEEMRLDFLNAPKWGNDDDYADEGVKWAVEIAIEEGLKFTDRWGAKPRPLPQAVTTFRQIGRVTGATPNGRFAGEVLADGGNSPRYGCDKKGPTAVLKSCSKLDYTKMKACLLNQRFSPASLEGEKGRRAFLAYMRAWHDLGIQQVQINVVDSEVLSAAQREPEKYTDLIVRVAGYSAYFIELDRETQDSIIARTEQYIA